MTEFHIKDGSLQLIHTRVTPHVVVDVFMFAAVVSKSTNHDSQIVVIGGYGTSIAKGTKILARIERVGGGIAKGACMETRC